MRKSLIDRRAATVRNWGFFIAVALLVVAAGAGILLACSLLACKGFKEPADSLRSPSRQQTEEVLESMLLSQR
jgi:hypothetical protein